jgi:uncharacterized protein YndB with AHSA1/START domain
VNDQPRGLVLELSWILAAPREQVFRALTDPATLAQWWGPSGFTTPEIDLRLLVGGRYRFGMQPPEGELFHLAGDFIEISPPSRLSYTFRWEEPDPDDRETVVRLSLDALGDTTKLSLSQGEFATTARLDLHRSGWTESVVKLRRLIESGGGEPL